MFENEELEKNSCQTLQELSTTLNFDLFTTKKRLQALGMAEKKKNLGPICSGSSLGEATVATPHLLCLSFCSES